MKRLVGILTAFAITGCAGTGASLLWRSGISLMATAATSAAMAPATPSQNVWAVATLNAPWIA